MRSTRLFSPFLPFTSREKKADRTACTVLTAVIDGDAAFSYVYKNANMTGELTEQEINNILSSQAIGRIACCDGKHPYIVPVTYAFDGKYIYGQSTEGRKLEMLRSNPNVCFQVDLSRDLSNWQSAVVFGQFEELSGENAIKARDLLEGRVLPLMTGSIIHQHEHWEGEGHELSENYRGKPVMFRIRIHEKSGRFERL